MGCNTKMDDISMNNLQLHGHCSHLSSYQSHHLHLLLLLPPPPTRRTCETLCLKSKSARASCWWSWHGTQLGTRA